MEEVESYTPDENKPNKPNMQEFFKREIEELESNQSTKLPTMNFPVDKVTKVMIDIAFPWQKYEEDSDKFGNSSIKKIIPVYHDNQMKNWWLNVKNPIYKEIVLRAAEQMKEGKQSFEIEIFRTGERQNTRYRVVK